MSVTGWQAASACAGNVGLALCTGANWLIQSRSDPAADWWSISAERLTLARRFGTLLVLVSLGLSLWLEAAVMGDTTVRAALPAVRPVLSSTFYGHCWIASATLGVVLAGLAACSAAQPHPFRDATASVALLLFMLTRALSGHAASAGMFSLWLLVDWTHLAAVSLWVGVVLNGLLLMLSIRSTGSAASASSVHLIDIISKTATVAMPIVIVTGLLNAIRTLGSMQNLSLTDYGRELIVKVLWALAAIALGGVNRQWVMPRLHGALDGRGFRDDLRRFKTVIGMESVVLVAALAWAAALSVTAPPSQ